MVLIFLHYTLYHLPIPGNQLIAYAHCVLLQQPITADNINMIVGELTNIVNQISDPADQSPDNLNVIATVFTNTTSLIESGSISVNDNVSSSSSLLILNGPFSVNCILLVS